MIKNLYVKYVISAFHTGVFNILKITSKSQSFVVLITLHINPYRRIGECIIQNRNSYPYTSCSGWQIIFSGTVGQYILIAHIHGFNSGLDRCSFLEEMLDIDLAYSKPSGKI